MDNYNQNPNPFDFMERCSIGSASDNLYFVNFTCVSGHSTKSPQDASQKAFSELEKIMKNDYAFDVDVVHQYISGSATTLNRYYTIIKAQIYSKSPDPQPDDIKYTIYSNVSADNTYIKMLHVIGISDELDSSISNAFKEIKKVCAPNSLVFDLNIKINTFPEGNLHRKFMTTITGSIYYRYNYSYIEEKIEQ